MDGVRSGNEWLQSTPHEKKQELRMTDDEVVGVNKK